MVIGWIIWMTEKECKRIGQERSCLATIKIFALTFRRQARDTCCNLHSSANIHFTVCFMISIMLQVRKALWKWKFVHF